MGGEGKGGKRRRREEKEGEAKGRTSRLQILDPQLYSVIGDKPFLWSEPKFDPPIITKLRMIDYVGDHYPYTNFS